ncbi:MAG TPA: hypothetical protein VF772_20875 [Terriglobales bacterium]
MLDPDKGTSKNGLAGQDFNGGDLATRKPAIYPAQALCHGLSNWILDALDPWLS